MQTYDTTIFLRIPIKLQVVAEDYESVASSVSVFELQAALRNRAKMMSATEVEALLDAAVKAENVAVADNEPDDGNAIEDAQDRAEAEL